MRHRVAVLPVRVSPELARGWSIFQQLTPDVRQPARLRFSRSAVNERSLSLLPGIAIALVIEGTARNRAFLTGERL